MAWKRNQRFGRSKSQQVSSPLLLRYLGWVWVDAWPYLPDAGGAPAFSDAAAHSQRCPGGLWQIANKLGAIIPSQLA